MRYLIKTDEENYRHVLRVEDETETHITITNPLFNCFGSVFNSYGRKRTITKKWLAKRPFVWMDDEMAKLYDNIKNGDSSSTLYKKTRRQRKRDGIKITKAFIAKGPER